MAEKRRVAIIIGSQSDLPQCLTGLEYLKEQQDMGNVAVVEVKVASIHRNTDEVLAWLKSMIGKIDFLIAGAGMANHLSGTCDAYLRYTLRDNKIIVIAVSFSDERNPEHTLAAELSIEHVPGHQMLYCRVSGSEGFFESCRAVVADDFTSIKLPDPRPTCTFNLEEALKRAKEKKGVKQDESF